MVDEGFMAATQSHRRDDSPSRRESSLVSIKSICIDLNCAIEEIQSPKHEHFSIRGYVSETRKTDKKACLPFVGDDMNLPPMYVPKFRWWQCSDCVPGDSYQTSDAAATGEKSVKSIAENEPEKASSDIDVFSSLPPKWKRKRPRSDVKKASKNASPAQPPIEEDELWDLNAPKAAAKTRPRKRKLVLEEDDEDEEMAPRIPVDKKLKGPVIEISDSDSEKENIMPTQSGLRPSTQKTTLKKPRRSYTRKRTVRTAVNPPVAAGMTSSGGAGSSALENLVLGRQKDSDVVAHKSIDNKVGEGQETNTKNQESSGRNTGIPDLNEPFVESDEDDNTSDDIPMDIVELLVNIRHERALDSSRSGFRVSSGPLMPGQHRMTGLSSGPNVVSRPTPTRKKVTFDLGTPSASKFDAKDKGKSVQTTVVKEGGIRLGLTPVDPVICRANDVHSSKRSFPPGRMPPLMGSSRAVDLAGPSSNLNLEFCTVNRNPADFGIPDDERNEYMISRKDLEPTKMNVAPTRKVKARVAGK